MKGFEPLRPVLFTALALMAFFAATVFERLVIGAADVLNDAGARMPAHQGLPRALHRFPALADRWLENTARAGEAETWILGTSISLYGFDPCRVANAASYARSAAQFGDMLDWATRAANANDHVRTIVLELSLGEITAPARDVLGNRAALLALSLRKMASGRGDEPVPPGAARAVSCASPFPDADRDLRQLPLLSPSEAFSRAEAAAQRSERLADWCAQAPGRRIVFHLPPANPAAIAAQPDLRSTLDALRASLESQIGSLARRHPDCRMAFHAPGAAGSHPRDWQDAVHFRSDFGTGLLNNMLAAP
jgi:hypothetical protein